MPKYIVKPNQRVTHGSEEEARAHYAKMQPGQTWAGFPRAPVHDYEEGDELDLTEEEAAAMPHAVCTPDEFAELSSPKAFIDKGYTREQAEAMATELRDGMAARAKARKAASARSALPYPATLPGGGNAPTDGSTEPNPRAVAKFPDDSIKKPQK